MAKINMTLQGKGGVGKSFVSSALAQWLAARGNKPLCIDTDPVNATFSGYNALNVRRLEIMEGDEINPRSFDSLIETLATTKAKSVVIDNGASSFLPLANYLISNDVPTLLKEEYGHELVIHSVVTGGQALLDTMKGFAQLASQVENVPFVVWLNSYWGMVEHEGKSFEQLEGYKRNEDRVGAIIHIPHRKAETFGHDISELLKARMTFEEAQADKTLTIMTRQRLKVYGRDLFDQLDAAAGVLG